MIFNKELYQTALALEINDVVQFHFKMKTPAVDEIQTARISHIDHDVIRGVVEIIYHPCKRPNSVQCGHGVLYFADHEAQAHPKSQWGWTTLEKVGTEVPVPFRPFTPRPGDLHYDPMH